ncbi:MAG: class I tRNA ligase family protein, partial [Anaerolineales bacterium]|nr:class I tRNA ligase family protein [Anaerolineales bacterium]
KVPRGDRSGVVVEPYLTDQWFVKIQPLADAAITAVEDGRIRFVPENWSRTYFEWMHNIQDWCISRQLWWGHRIPAWYDADGNIFVGRSEQEVRIQHKLDDTLTLRRDEDVLDTWFSSALWPFSTLGWPQQTEALKQFYPTNVLVTGFDIIFFWVARMIMMGLKFMGDVPFHEVYVHGLVLDAHGQKMSKSKGNILDPIDLVDGIELEALVEKRTTGLMQPDMAPKIEKATREDFPQGIPAFGTDALRFTFAALASQSRNINFDMGRIEGYRNFCNKLWNAARFVLMNSDGEDCGQSGSKVVLSLADRWIISRLQQVELQVEKHLADYRFDLVSQNVYSFVWDEYCSWYLELSKVTLYDDKAPAERLRGTRRTLVRVLETILRLLHPIMPFITEEIWLKVAVLAGKSGDTIMLQPYPITDEDKIDEQSIKEMEWIQSVINAVRNIRGEMNIDPKKELRISVADADPEQTRILDENLSSLTIVARISNIDFVLDGKEISNAASALVENAKIMVPLGDLIDKDAEVARLSK